MNTYEFTFLIEDAKELKAIEKALVSFSGKKLNENPWGKRLLAYPINKLTGAEYYTWHIHIDGEHLQAFQQKLNYDKLVLRYLLLDMEHAPEMTKEPKTKKVSKVKETKEEPTEEEVKE